MSNENTLNFSEAKAEKNGTVTPKHIADDLAEYIERNPDDIETVVTVVKRKDGHINYGCSTAGALDIIGMLEVAKILKYEDM